MTAAFLVTAWMPAALDAQPGVSIVPGSHGEVLILGRQPALSQRSQTPLTPEQIGELRRAQGLRAQGRVRDARRIIEALRREASTNALVLTELGQLMLADNDFLELERLARRERAAQADSLLLGHELTIAYERLGNVARAAQVVTEMWIAAPAEGDWTRAALERLYPAEPAGVTRALRAALQARPDRADLALGLARFEWQQGDQARMLDALRTADRHGQRPPLRWTFAEERLRGGGAADSIGALEALVDLAGDGTVDLAYRTPAARRVWAMYQSLGRSTEGAKRVADALRDMPAERWDSSFLVEIARALRESGRTGDARRLMAPFEDRAALVPELAIERALADLRDGPPERAFAALEATAGASQEGLFYLAEARFFAGAIDSALGAYQRVVLQPRGPYAGQAFERIYLLEDTQPRSALPAFGRVAYAEWRGDRKGALAGADSLYRALPRGELWSHAAMLVAGHESALGRPAAALGPLLAVADSMPEARLASLARQKAGETYLLLGNDAAAMAQFEECLARYPRAWNAPEVRRKLQQMRRERRL
jgi:tetratricopeptide (TPR) repeat protein